jgi:hypothetical protein
MAGKMERKTKLSSLNSNIYQSTETWANSNRKSRNLCRKNAQLSVVWLWIRKREDIRSNRFAYRKWEREFKCLKWKEESSYFMSDRFRLSEEGKIIWTFHVGPHIWRAARDGRWVFPLEQIHNGNFFQRGKQKRAKSCWLLHWTILISRCSFKLKF